MAQGSGFSQLFQSASQALGITGSSPMRGILSQLGMDRGGLGSQLTEQVSGETDEQRRKRMRDQQQGGLGGGQASFDLFGGMGGLSY
jgi:hypothetical protein